MSKSLPPPYIHPHAPCSDIGMNVALALYNTPTLATDIYRQLPHLCNLFNFHFIHLYNCLGRYFWIASLGFLTTLLILESTNETSPISVGIFSSGSDFIAKYKVKVVSSFFFTMKSRAELVFLNVYPQDPRWENRDGCAAVTASHCRKLQCTKELLHLWSPCWCRQRFT